MKESKQSYCPTRQNLKNTKKTKKNKNININYKQYTNSKEKPMNEDNNRQHGNYKEL
jgi:hypothetical protein